MQNVFVFNQGVRGPSLVRALPVVVTAAFCDTLLILLAVLGVSVVVLKIAWLQTVLYVVGCLFLLYIGLMTWKSAPLDPARNGQAGRGEHSAKKQIVFAVSVSLLNPHAILDTIGVIGANSLHYAGQEKWAFTLATVFVSCVWFLHSPSQDASSGG